MIFGKPPDHLSKVATLIKDFWKLWVAVKSFKTQIRRLLKQADVGSECWPLAARYADALNRSWRLGDAPSFPPFMQEVLVRRRMETGRLRAHCGNCQVLDIGFKVKKTAKSHQIRSSKSQRTNNRPEVGRN